MHERHDQVVEEYLTAVRRAAADLPAASRDELIADLTEHVAAARHELRPETEAGVRTILDRLGEPAQIVAEARGTTVATPAPTPPPPRRSGLRTLLVVLVAVVLSPILVCVVGAALFLLNTGSSPVEPNPSVGTPVSGPSRSAAG